MDKILSARVDESVIQRLNLLARQLRKTKKAIIEGAILSYADQISSEQQIDVLDLTFGVWQRGETVDETVRKTRHAFQEALERRQK